jgi:hypothetical protein
VAAAVHVAVAVSRTKSGAPGEPKSKQAVVDMSRSAKQAAIVSVPAPPVPVYTNWNCPLALVEPVVDRPMLGPLSTRTIISSKAAGAPSSVTVAVTVCEAPVARLAVGGDMVRQR